MSRFNTIGVLASLCLLSLNCFSSRTYYEPYVEPQYRIMGYGNISQRILGDFLLSKNPSLQEQYARYIAALYVMESDIEGINHDVAFAQMCHETGYLAYGGVVEPDQNNFAGLGAFDDYTPGDKFASVEEGVRAHIQHLKSYASDQPLGNPPVNRRFNSARRGSISSIYGLTGLWATDPLYAEKIKSVVDQLYAWQ